MTYQPEYIKDEPTRRELQRIADEFTLIRQFEISYVEPEKPRLGLVVYADGTEWDPGSGEGIYRFNSSATWAFVG